MSDSTIAVLVAGSGVMGKGIALSFARAGLKTAILSRNPNVVSGVEPGIDILGVLPSEAPELIVETIPEVMGLKLELNAQIEEVYQGDSIIASNTSSLSLQKLANALRFPAKFCGMHYFHPADVTPIVEVAAVAQSDDATIQKTLTMLRQAGKQPIALSEPVDGLLINRLQQAIYHEAYSLIDRGICSAKDIDLAAKQLLGPRMSVTGMIEQKDLSGLDTHALAQRELIPILHLSREPSPVVQRKYAAGHFGTKTGTGFYDWREMDVPAYRQKTDALLTKMLQLLDDNRPPAPPAADGD
ncbi:MAG: 3-hydroxyacyl-CoA dehydrogenase NAD-binding domain-containing protein [Alphaproteobacteria bacterium]|nr:3-hydroxyacyl-CoA dehydrogenase NAD-binding domain-containing protein [Alphaproteobacteria bacterium]MDP7461097.1 3-hydroxyacyl-CoA dehydrogenase NAD-binding domain-containing protein [Alphaproteobacteria bacterium]